MWNLYTKSNITRIESIQRRATKFILKSDDEYLVRLREVRLLSLEDRRFMQMLFFIRWSIIMFAWPLILGFGSPGMLTSMDTPNLLTSLSRTNLFKLSFMKRIVGEWNSLPFDIRGASSVEDFKLKVSTFLTLWIFVYTIIYIFLIFYCVCVYIFISRSIGRFGVFSLNGAVALFQDSSTHFYVNISLLLLK